MRKPTGRGVEWIHRPGAENASWDDYKDSDDALQYKGNQWMCSDNSRNGAFIKGARGYCGGTQGHHESFFLT